jgi:hypothetical protein
METAAHIEHKAKKLAARNSETSDMPNNVLTVEKCISFLKENGYTGKIEKVINYHEKRIRIYRI